MIQRLADAVGTDKKTVEKLLASLSDVIAGSAAMQEAVAIPSFGSFEAVKYDEEEKTDLSTGKRMLYPPQIVLEFNPAHALRSSLK